MKKCGIIFVILCLWLSPAVAQQVTIRGGEHEGYSRLVFDLPRRLTWELDDFGNGFALRFEQSGIALNTQSALAKLDQNRITAVKAAKSSSSVFVELGCACRVETFWHGDSMLVVDIIEDIASLKERFSRSADDALVDQHNIHHSSQLQLPSAGTSRTVRLFETAVDLEKQPSETETRDAQDPEVLSDVNQSLLRQVARATTQGLLKARTALVEKAEPKETAKPPQSTEKANPSESSQATDNLNIKVVTSIDRDFLAGLESGTPFELTSPCLPAEQVDVSAWVGDESFSHQIGHLRAALTNELDRPEHMIAEELIRSYLFFGFGAEALNVQATFLPSGENQETYSALANILDGEPGAAASVFSNQLSCDGPAAFWAALSQPNLPGDAEINTDAILLTFSNLPRHLRAHLGPILSRHFLDAGYVDESAQILRVLERVEETQSPESLLAKAQHFVATGQEILATPQFEAVVEAESRASPIAVVEMIETMLSLGQKIPSDIAELAGAYAFEHQSDEIGPALKRAHVLALASSGQFSDAFQEFESALRTNDVAARALRSELADILAISGDQYDILRFAFSGQLGEVQDLPPKAAYLIAQNLSDTGFHDAAQEFLSRAFPKNMQRKVRLLRAQTALNLESPNSAEAELLGLEGEDIVILRARAKSMSGDHHAAADLYESTGRNSDATRERWLAKGWETMPEDSGVFGDIADIHTGVAETGNLGQLAASNALIARAANSRLVIEAMLEQVPDLSDLQP